MKKGFELSQTDFDNLLGWLAPNREEAGVKYEEIRNGLIKFFRFRGCDAPDALADETINRVAAKVSAFTDDGAVKKISFFYGFASNIHLEYVTRTRKPEVSFDPELHSPEGAADAKDKSHECLEICLARLPAAERKLIIEYYEKDKSAKFEWRKKLAAAANMSTGALHTKVCRLKKNLKNCLEKCLREK